jgi:hypothetical protein
MKNLYRCLPMAFVLLACSAFGAEANQYVVGVTGMT